MTSGIRNYQLIYRLVSDNKPYHYANFYRCHDRKKRDRFFAEVYEADSEFGGSFLITRENYVKFSSQIEKLQTKIGEQDAAKQSHTACSTPD